MTPDMEMRISARNEAGPVLNEVGRDILAVGKRADVASTSITRMGTATARSMKMANFQTRNLMFQLNDVGVSLASGMNPLMVMIQQGSQIATIYGPDEGGIGMAFKETGRLALGFATKFWPIGLAAGVAAAAIFDMTNEINAATNAGATMGDVTVASFQVMADGIANSLMPAINAIAPAMTWVWDRAMEILKQGTNNTIGIMVGPVNALIEAWKGFPATVGEAAINAANLVVEGIEWMVNRSIDGLNAVIDLANQVPGVDIAGIGAMELGRMDNPYAGAAGDQASRMTQAFLDGLGRDYLGEFFDAVKNRTLSNLASDAEELGAATGAANDNTRDLAESVETLANEMAGSLKSAWTGFFQDFAKDIGQGMNAWQAFANAGLNALGSIGNKMIELGANQLFDQLFGTMLSAFSPFGALGGSPINLLAANGAAFDQGNVMAFARGGVVNAPTMFPMTGGAGLMGEAGPEAILPLRRGANGRLGVEAANSNGGTTQHFHIDARGAQLGVGAEIAQALRSYDREVLPARVRKLARG